MLGGRAWRNVLGVKGAGVSRSSETQVSGRELMTFWMKEIPSPKDASDLNFDI